MYNTLFAFVSCTAPRPANRLVCAMNSNMPTFDAIVFPADDRPPHIVPLMISAVSLPAGSSAEPYRCGRAPHPEVYMDYIADQLGSQAWRYHVRLISPPD